MNMGLKCQSCIYYCESS